ncbi:hypothetical protein LTR95_008856 [Oleoguttula sp. CCFEE 5521]
MAPLKRSGDEAGLDDASSNSAKLQRLDAYGNGNGDNAPTFPYHEDSQPSTTGGSSKKRASNAAASTRTGQACDRCKVRKIRCDARPGGCSPCLQNNTECTTTDRISGAARSRGHTEKLENENSALKQWVATLQQQMRENKIEPIDQPGVPNGYAPAPALASSYYGSAPNPRSGDCDTWAGLQSSHAEDHGHHAQSGTSDKVSIQPSLLADFRAGCIGDNYLGVSCGNNWLSPIEGTCISLFGAKVDLAEYMPKEDESPNSGASYQSFIDHAFGGVKVDAPPLPPWETGRQYAEWFFGSCQPFIPVLHKPDFHRLLENIYHKSYQPTIAERVMVHGVMAILEYQYTARNVDPPRAQNYAHWHYAISFIPQLIKGHTLEDMQALTLICTHLRNFPRPAAAWMFTNTVLGLAVELGLHRSANAWQTNMSKHDPHVIQMRQRTFWTLIVVHVNISGKLGRPMPFRLEDFDIEIPEISDDNLPEESDLDSWRKCTWAAGRYGMELTRVMMKVYSSIYNIRSPTHARKQYEASVRELSQDLKACVASFPPELSGGPRTRHQDRVSALYLEFSAQSCQLLIHHPALCRSPSPQAMSDNLDACLEASARLLSVAKQLRMLKSLDQTMYSNMDNIAAIFTTLFAYTERRDTLTNAALISLRQDMQGWMSVLGELGQLLGTGPKLQNAIGKIVEESLSKIQRHLVAKTAMAAVASANEGASRHELSPSQQHQQLERFRPAPVAQTSRVAQPYDGGYDPSPNGHSAASHAHQSNGYAPQPPPLLPQESSTPTYHNYNQSASLPAYPSHYPTSAPYTPQDAKPVLQPHLAAQAALAQQQQQQQQPQYSPYNPTYPIHSPHASGSTAQLSGQMAWRTFAENLVGNMAPDNAQQGQGQSGEVNGFVGLSNGVAAGIGGQGYAFGEMQMPTSGSSGEGATWPMIHYGA